MNQASLSFLVLKTNNIAACRTFYESLGISFVEERHGQGPTHYAASLQGLVLEIYPAIESEAENQNFGAGIILGIEVGSLYQTVQRLSAITDLPKHFVDDLSQDRLTVIDPEGRKVLLYERKS